MDADVEDLLARCRPKIRALLRTKNMYSVSDMITQFKTHIWGLLEYHTPAIYYGIRSLVAKVDHLQESFLAKLDVSIDDVFLHHNMAPLKVRRDIGLLGMLHKRVLGFAHPSFNVLFPFVPERTSPVHGRARHNKQLGNHHQSVMNCAQL